MIKRIKVLAYEYTVEVEKSLAARREALAEFDPAEAVLRLDDIAAEHQPENHLMHEVLESISWQLAIPSKTLDHKTLTALGNMVAAVLRDNPEFTEMFLDDAELAVGEAVKGLK